MLNLHASLVICVFINFGGTIVKATNQCTRPNKQDSKSQIFNLVVGNEEEDKNTVISAKLAKTFEDAENAIDNTLNKNNIFFGSNYTSLIENIFNADLDFPVPKNVECINRKKTINCDHEINLKYRTIDGTCNNLANPSWGATLTPFRRLLPPVYEDGITQPVGWNPDKKYQGFRKPTASEISTNLLSTKNLTPDDKLTHMVMNWGQFLDHDMSKGKSPKTGCNTCVRKEECLNSCTPLKISKDDPRANDFKCLIFTRNVPACDQNLREQINDPTSYIDTSQVYGTTPQKAQALRDPIAGGLRVGPKFPGGKYFLPLEKKMFKAGDTRVNAQVGLICMHTVFMREHNRLVVELKTLNPHWDNEILYQEARKILGALAQHITYKHWLPLIIGDSGLKMLGQYKEYNPKVDPSLFNVFGAAVFRFGHTLVGDHFSRLDANFSSIKEGPLSLLDAFFAPDRVINEGGIDPILRGLLIDPLKAQKPTENINSILTGHLFEKTEKGLDLAAINVHRGREHGLPSYNSYRKYCNLTMATTFKDLEISNNEAKQKLEKLYGHPENIDVYVGGILEDHIPDGRVGKLFQCLMVKQFRHLRDGDRFYYENPSVFTPAQLNYIKQSSLSQLLCLNGDKIDRVTKNAFVQAKLQGGIVKCSSVVGNLSLGAWKEVL